jgi:hypothetical protein
VGATVVSVMEGSPESTIECGGELQAVDGEGGLEPADTDSENLTAPVRRGGECEEGEATGEGRLSYREAGTCSRGTMTVGVLRRMVLVKKSPD